MTGKIKFYNQEKEFGFILGSDGEDYWFHISKILKPPKIIKTNTEVDFDVLTTPKGLNATNIIFENTDKQENLNATCPVCNTENNLHLKNCKNCDFTLKYVNGWHLQISPSEASQYRKTLSKAKKEYSEKTRKKTRQPNNKTSKKQEKVSKPNYIKNDTLINKITRIKYKLLKPTILSIFTDKNYVMKFSSEDKEQPMLEGILVVWNEQFVPINKDDGEVIQKIDKVYFVDGNSKIKIMGDTVKNEYGYIKLFFENNNMSETIRLMPSEEKYLKL